MPLNVVINDSKCDENLMAFSTITMRSVDFSTLTTQLK